MHFQQIEGVGCLVYEGEYDENHRKHGHGVLTWADGRQYKGQFANDDFHGEGVMTWPDGNKYVGHYANGNKEGDGILYLPNGSKLSGQFVEGKKHGQFTHTKSDGTEKLRQFNLDRLCDNDAGSSAIAKSDVSSKATTESANSNSLDKKFTALFEDEEKQRRALPTKQTPQRWRVIDPGGVVVRASSSLTSPVVGTIKQNEELLIVGARGRRLCVANPVEGVGSGWVSTETEWGLTLMERIDRVEQPRKSLQRKKEGHVQAGKNTNRQMPPTVKSRSTEDDWTVSEDNWTEYRRRASGLGAVAWDVGVTESAAEHTPRDVTHSTHSEVRTSSLTSHPQVVITPTTASSLSGCASRAFSCGCWCSSPCDRAPTLDNKVDNLVAEVINNWPSHKAMILYGSAKYGRSSWRLQNVIASMDGMENGDRGKERAI